VSKEYIASREDEQGVLILSTFAAKPRTLGRAIDQSLRRFATLRFHPSALEMSEEEQARPNAADATYRARA